MAGSLSFVVAAPTKVGRTKIGQDLGAALERLGHSVAYFDYDREPVLYRVLPRVLRVENWRQKYIEYVNTQVLDFVKDIRPDIFLCVKGVQFRADTIRAIGRAGVTTVGYWTDDPLDHARSLVNAGSYDYYFTNDASSVQRYRNEGITQTRHLQLAADPEKFYPLPRAESVAEVVFVGTHSPRRESVVVGLQDFDTHVYGSAAWNKARIDRSRIHPGVFGAQTNEVFNRARINLNIHTWFGQGSAMNLRLFEVPASGGFLLTDWVAEIDAAYRENEHLVCWRTVEDLREKVVHYLAREDERREIAARGREHFLRHHSYAARARELLGHLQ